MDCLDWRLSLIVLGHIGGETLAKDGLLLMMHPNLSEQNIQARQLRVGMSDLQTSRQRLPRLFLGLLPEDLSSTGGRASYF